VEEAIVKKKIAIPTVATCPNIVGLGGVTVIVQVGIAEAQREKT
jgi:hypothetical protein